PPLHFLVESRVLERPGPRRFLVAERYGDAVGALVLAPIPARDGAFVEWIWQTRRAPNGTASLLLDHAFALASGDAMLTLGMVPLSSFAPLTDSPPPRHIRALLAWMQAHARRFYNFEGLERFKAKFQPEAWEPLYLLTPEARVGTGLLHAVADAFAGPDRSPEALVTLALGRALREEASGAMARVRRRLSPR
ncbi:MAG: phosphatidylglycerol lysyltransferase domain-containing protein, partial [Bacteroidota bacterium]